METNNEDLIKCITHKYGFDRNATCEAMLNAAVKLLDEHEWSYDDIFNIMQDANPPISAAVASFARDYQQHIAEFFYDTSKWGGEDLLLFVDLEGEDRMDTLLYLMTRQELSSKTAFQLGMSMLYDVAALRHEYMSGSLL